MAKKKRKLRANFRKNHTSAPRDRSLTRAYEESGDAGSGDIDQNERVSGKGRFTRKRTVAGAEVIEDATGEMVLLDVNRDECVEGRVLRVQGLVSTVLGDDGKLYACATRRILKQLATDLRHVVAAGDRVWLRPEGRILRGPEGEEKQGLTEGIIERVEPRAGVLSRSSRYRQHLIATHVNQIVIVASAAEPRIKPNLIDRFLITAEKAGIEPILCINKMDLVEPADFVPLVGVYSQLGYQVLPISAESGFGIESLRSLLRNSRTAFTGQSGVGKSSLLNAIEPGLALRVKSVSSDTNKGRHTTTTSELYPLGKGSEAEGFLVDTPGIRSFELWDVIAEEVSGFFPELRPYVSQCRFPDCTHTHEQWCAVKDAVADGWIDARRYESYMQIQSGE